MNITVVRIIIRKRNYVSDCIHHLNRDQTYWEYIYFFRRRFVLRINISSRVQNVKVEKNFKKHIVALRDAFQFHLLTTRPTK